VPALVAPVLSSVADAAIGSRWADGGRAQAGGAERGLVRLQKVLTGAMNRLFARIAGTGVRDWTSGFIAVQASRVRASRLDGRHGEYFIQLTAHLISRGARIVEVPYRWAPRECGRSKTASDPVGFARIGVRYLAAWWKAGRILNRSRAS
jgi:hypothetical protein